MHDAIMKVQPDTLLSCGNRTSAHITCSPPQTLCTALNPCAKKDKSNMLPCTGTPGRAEARTLVAGGQLVAADGAAVVLRQPGLEAGRMKRVRCIARHHLHALARRQLLPARPATCSPFFAKRCAQSACTACAALRAWPAGSVHPPARPCTVAIRTLSGAMMQGLVLQCPGCVRALRGMKTARSLQGMKYARSPLPAPAPPGLQPWSHSVSVASTRTACNACQAAGLGLHASPCTSSSLRNQRQNQPKL